jgi:hypothetical protein
MNSGSPFHPGEIAAQERAGVRSRMEKIGGVVMRDYLPEQHRDFFAQLPTLLLGASDAEGRIWASILCGEPGFVRSPDPAMLRIDAHPAAGDPLAAALRPGRQAGLLGLQFETRRRNRANGVIANVDGPGFNVDVRQSFGNCPKYIQTRTLLERAGHAAMELQVLEGAGALPADALALISRSDTFFIASAAEDGIDVSHRGGPPGFVEIDAQGALRWRDFQGNNYFNTIGNLLADGRAGLLFADFEQGHLLHLSGRAQVQWEDDTRTLHFTAERHVLRPNALPLRWRLRQMSPYLPSPDISPDRPST